MRSIRIPAEEQYRLIMKCRSRGAHRPSVVWGARYQTRYILQLGKTTPPKRMHGFTRSQRP